MSDIVGNPEDRFSYAAAHIISKFKTAQHGLKCVKLMTSFYKLYTCKRQ